VDVIVELGKYGSLQTDRRRRKLFAVSRYPETPRTLVYEWAEDGTFHSLGDPQSARFRDNWTVLRTILAKRKKAATHQELLMDRPAGDERPSASTLYEWLNRAYEQKLLRRFGGGRAKDPYVYRLENEDDEYLDRGELPPMKELNWAEMYGR
jgi:hypothetical protein